MAQKNTKNVGLRVTPEVHQKLQYIARYEGRTINGLAHYLFLSCIREFETKNGPIPLESEQDK